VIAMAAVSGALHLDGLADTADAFMSGAGKEKMLAIMKDSRAGPMAVFAVSGVLLLKAASLASAPVEARWTAVFLAALAGRCAMVVALSLASYVRPSGGLGVVFAEKQSPAHSVWALGFLLVVCLIIGGGAGLAVWLLTVAAAFAFGSVCHAKIGGMTGDNYGALCELAEAAALFAACAWLAGGAA